MKFSINQSELLNALTVVNKGISQRASLPILAGVYVEARGDEVSFQTTDLEMSVQYGCAALIDEPGATVLPGKLFIDIVKNLPDAAVHIEAGEDGAVISCESSSFSIHCLNAADFPGFPQVAPEQQVSVPFEVFASMARKVSRVVSKDESRMILTGVLIAVEEGVLKLVATDSYRLAVTEHPLEGVADEEFSAVLAGGFVADLAGLPQTGENITFALAENQVIVTYGGTTFVNRRIEGKYPNYKQLLPSGYETRCVMKRSDFAGAIKRASLLDAGSQVRISVNAPSQTLQLNTTQETGSTQEIVRGTVEGEDVEIGFNSFYVNDGLSAMSSQEVALELQGALKPGILRGVGDEGYLYLVMPVRI